MESITVIAAEFDRRAERITELTDLLVDVLRKAQRPGSVLSPSAGTPGAWHWLWDDNGSIGHERVDERLLGLLREVADDA